jgi:hypothetical protein
MQGLYFVYFYKTYCYSFLMFRIYIFFLDLWDVFMWTGNLRTLFCLTKRWQILHFMFYFPCSPEHKIFLLFTELNNEDTTIFWDGELIKQTAKCFPIWGLCQRYCPGLTIVCQMSTLYCGKKGGVQKYFLLAQMSIQCVECAITEIYLLLVARNLLKYILLLSN